MKAANAYRVHHGRDSVEVVEIASGEVVLFWDLPPREAARRVRRLREDLGRLDDDEFLERWDAVEPQD